MRPSIVATAAIALLPFGASAATLSVSTLPIGFYGATTAVVPEATLTSFGNDFYFNGAYNDPGSFCAISFGSCDADLQISFVGSVTNLMFDVGGWNDGDLVTLNIFGATNALLGSISITSDLIGLNLTSFGPITRLFFDDSSTGAGVGYANFSFTQVASVPLPATLPLLAGALGAAFVARRKRKAA